MCVCITGLRVWWEPLPFFALQGNPTQACIPTRCLNLRCLFGITFTANINGSLKLYAITESSALIFTHIYSLCTLKKKSPPSLTSPFKYIDMFCSDKTKIRCKFVKNVFHLNCFPWHWHIMVLLPGHKGKNSRNITELTLCKNPVNKW